MATRKRTRRSNSKIGDAQKSAFERREERRKKQDEAIAAQKKLEDAGAPKTGALGPTQLKPRSPNITRMQGSDESAPGAQGINEAFSKISGLVTDLKAEAAVQRRSALANTKLYGGTSDKAIKERLAGLKDAADEQRRKGLRKTGSAVYLGKRKITTGHAAGPDGLRFGQTADYEADNIVDKSQLIAWLTDGDHVTKIQAQAQEAGLDVQSYDDVAKLWRSVVEQAAEAYSLTGKRVTPMELIALRGKSAVGGRPASRTTTSTSIEEMDPAQARLMFEKAAQEHLGRRATKAEIDDFIAKAQTIATSNPNVTTTTTQYGFDGEAESQSSFSRGGADAVAAQSQVAANDMAMEDEEYGAYQAAGFYMPELFRALGSPV